MFLMSDVSKTYKDFKIFTNINLSAEKGECLGIAGENGCGKSTLLRIAAGVDRNFSGTITADGETVSGNTKLLREKFAYVPQDVALAEFLTVAQQIEFWQKAIGQKNAEILDLLDIPSLAKKPISSLSGGQKKRLSIAMALQSRADYIIMDEAFAALDSNYREIITQWLLHRLTQNVTILWCSHEKQELERLCSRCVHIKNGALI